MLGRDILPTQNESDALGRTLNKIRDELRRLGNVKGVGGITVDSNSMGIFINGSDSKEDVHHYYFKNYSGKNCPEGGVIKIGAIEEWDDTTTTFQATQPDNQWSRWYGISAEDVKPNETGKCYFYSPDPQYVAYDVGGSLIFGPRPNTWNAAGGYPGFLCVGGVPSDDLMIAVQQQVDVLAGITDGQISAIGGNVKLVTNYGQQTNMNISVSNWLLNSGEIIGDGRKVIVQWLYGNWVIVQAECG